MANFISAERLDYLCEADVFIRKESDSVPVYYCDAAFFRHHEAGNENWCEKICDLPEKLEYVSKVEILLQSRASKFDKNSILKLCRPQRNSSLLQCEFSNSIF